MDQMELMKQRHSVRQFTDKALDSEAVKLLQSEIDACNKEGGMHIQLITDEPEAFQAGKPSYGQFKGCWNYLAIVGPKGKDVEAGYYGERIVLEAAILAPTAMNQQKFRFERNGDKVTAKVAGLGFYTKIDLGIVKYHFEVGSGKGNEVWG